MTGKIYSGLSLLLLTAFPARGETVKLAAFFGEAQTFWTPPAADNEPGSLKILPVFLEDYRESKPCDSCHWLSENGLVFILENYLRRTMTELAPQWNTELIHPESELALSNELQLEKKSLELTMPWSQIFAEYREPVLYRTRDSFTPEPTSRILTAWGGKLGADFLVSLQGVRMKVFPTRSNDHTGKFELKFYLILWDVRASIPQWIVFFKSKTGTRNLDITLDKFLEKQLTPYLVSLPEKLSALKNQEPR